MKNIKISGTCWLTLALFLTSFIPLRLNAQPEKGVKPVVMTGLQMEVSVDVNANLHQIMEGIDKAADEGASFLVTPEGSLSGYNSDFDQKEVSYALDKIRAEASAKKVGLILGTCFKQLVKGREFCFNEVRVYAPEGNFLGEYSKILRCSSLDLPGSGEMTDYIEGNLKTFEWNGNKFGILICNDLWATPGYTTIPNPYLAWKLKQMGAQFIIHCINSGSAQRYRAFHEASAELWALSVKLPVMEVNAVEPDEKVNAQSGLIDSDGERNLKVPDSGVQYFTVKIYPAVAQENPNSGFLRP